MSAMGAEMTLASVIDGAAHAPSRHCSPECGQLNRVGFWLWASVLQFGSSATRFPGNCANGRRDRELSSSGFPCIARRRAMQFDRSADGNRDAD